MQPKALVEDRILREPELVTANLGSPGELDVLPGDPTLVESAELFEDLAPDAAVAAACKGQKQESHVRPVGTSLEPASVDRPVETTDVVPARDQVTRSSGVHELAQPVAGHDVVRVAERQKITGRHPGTGISSVGGAGALAGVHEARRRKRGQPSSCQLAGSIDRAVVGDDQFPDAVVVLSGQSVELLGEMLLLVPDRDDDADEARAPLFRRAFESPIRRVVRQQKTPA
jgi:hypothetical protein